MNDIELLNPVPKWAAWLAQDFDGGWYVFDAEPRRADLPLGGRNYGLGARCTRSAIRVANTELVDDHQSLIDLRS